MQASTSGPKNRLDISYIFSQKTTVPEKEEEILKLFQDNSISRDTWLVYEELWRAIRKKPCDETVWYRWKWKLRMKMMMVMMMRRNFKIRQFELDTMWQTCSQQRSWLLKSTKRAFESWFGRCHKIEKKKKNRSASSKNCRFMKRASSISFHLIYVTGDTLESMR